MPPLRHVQEQKHAGFADKQGTNAPLSSELVHEAEVRRCDIQRVERLTRRIVVADVRWPLLDSIHRGRSSESSCYALMREQTGNVSCE